MRLKFDATHKTRRYKNWTTAKYIEEVKTFVTSELELPAALCDHDNIMNMFTILFPCASRSALDSTNTGGGGGRILFHCIFKENNTALRREFFSHPLAKYLWSKIFIVESPETVIVHLRRLRSLPEYGLPRCRRQLSDMRSLETEFNFKLLPDTAREIENVLIFSARESYIDLISNGYHNKKKSKTVSDKIAKYEQYFGLE